MNIFSINPEKKDIKIPNILPLLPIRDMIVFPSIVTPLAVGRDKSIKAVEAAMATNRLILVVTQKKARVEDPSSEDIFNMGTVCDILQMLKTTDGKVKILVEGVCRARWTDFKLSDKGYIEVGAAVINEKVERTPEVEAVVRNASALFDQYIKLNPRVPAEISMTGENTEDLTRFADTMASYVNLKQEDKQFILETVNPVERIERLITVLTSEIEILNIEKRIQSRIRNQIDKSQKEYYLNEQMKAIQKELKQKDDTQKDIDDLRAKLKSIPLPKEARESAEKELSRLERMMPMSPEASVIRTYLEWIIDLPWEKSTKDNLELIRAKEILDKDHYGLTKVKDRILEYLAVLSRVKKIKGPILCFIGPPGVGKTSIAKSIASSLGRNFVRISMGGLRDEAEIRGHRRTYIGSMPGKIIQSMKKAGSNNPVFILDEIDKIGADWRGDPASALLEVLDPEQNYAFGDHYLDVDFDLSKVMFITTANTLHNIPTTLLDRLELIRFSGYTDEEKQKIASIFIVPQQMKEHGLTDEDLTIEPNALRNVIKNYTHEAGVRNLTREIANLCRKSAKELGMNKDTNHVTITAQNLDKYLGIPYFEREKIAENGIGVVTGLAWTEVGGETLTIEINKMKGKGALLLTGKLGDVMKESAQAALTYVRSSAKTLGIDETLFKDTDFHVHVPEGAVPKDGPSAGTALATALASLCMDKPVKKGLAMTGEVTLRGRVLGIGGLKEKVLAAYREGINMILFPKSNEKDLADIPNNIQEKIKMIPVSHMDEIIEIAVDKNNAALKTNKSKKIRR
ncbi:MAG: endopeptidase La [Elusimicrobiota bacterium]|nr:endopeptidase La [Elusimicrobiota bacterium]